LFIIHASALYALLIIPQEHVFFIEASNTMDSSRILARQALAELFDALKPQKAHWYSIKAPTTKDPYSDRIDRLFPSLGTLLSLTTEIMNFVLEASALMRWKDKKKWLSSPCLKSWENFKHEFKLHIEFTTFQISSKRYNFIRVGSWYSKHPPVTPKEVWSAKVDYCVPRLRIATLTMNFASMIGKFYSEQKLPEDEVIEESSVSSSDEDNKAVEKEVAEANDVAVPAKLFQCIDLPQQDFPLLHSLGIQKQYQFNALLQEIVKYSGNVMEFMQKNNRSGFLLLCPSSRSTDGYKSELSKKGGPIDSFLDVISNNAKCSGREAAESILRVLYKKHEEAFTSVALEKGLMLDEKKKMDAVQVEAMLSEAGLCSNNSRILFRHLNNFFGKGRFESEHKRRAFFAGNEFPPVVDRKVLTDKTIIDFWYKEPDKMLQHQIDKIIDRDQLEGLTRIDITVGGDHGGGKFRMTMKILFRLQRNQTISRLFQIASVSHSKDDTEILESTVLKPIGESLRRITEGGNFIVFNDISNSLTSALGVTYQLNVR
jgi:hypothetical protein